MNPALFEELPIVSEKELSLVQEGKVPYHVAIVMDGNRRWARQKFMPNVYGHWKGASIITKIVKAAADLGVKVLTLYSFSTENWARSPEEVEEIMRIFTFYLRKQRDFMIEEGVRLDTIGDLSRLPLSVQQIVEETKKATENGWKIDLVLAMNYGGRDDIRRAVISLVSDCEEGKIQKEQISEDLISGYLDTAQWEDPDLLIRTSGENRLSNFLLWQLSYTEVYITKTLWPDFNEKHFLQAILEYQQRERRHGGA